MEVGQATKICLRDSVEGRGEYRRDPRPAFDFIMMISC